jgi:hypothetical protein
VGFKMQVRGERERERERERGGIISRRTG